MVRTTGFIIDLQGILDRDSFTINAIVSSLSRLKKERRRIMANVAIVVTLEEDQLRVTLRQYAEDRSFEELAIGMFEPHMLGIMAAFAAATRLCEEYGLEEPEKVGFAD